MFKTTSVARAEITAPMANRSRQPGRIVDIHGRHIGIIGHIAIKLYAFFKKGQYSPHESLG